RDGGAIMNRPVSLSVTKTSPREILNRLVREHGDVIWASSFVSRSGVAGVGARVEDWVITLTPIAAPGPVISLTASNLMRASALLPPMPRSPSYGPQTMTLDLPVTALALSGALRMMGRSLGTPIGFEGVSTPVTPLSVERPTDYYDLSGLEGQELLDKLA